MKTKTTDTPRTDEACEAMGLKAFVVPVETSRQLERELAEKTNEVARLRELLNRAIENCECRCRSLCDCGRADRNEEIRKELAQLATAPEEPVTEKDTKVSVNDQQHTENVNDHWRELGPDEVIQEGDEYTWGEYWHDVDLSVTYTPSSYPNFSFRTRRLLPVQEEMPRDIDVLIDTIAFRGDRKGEGVFYCVADSIRYLRDEIQKLKSETHYHHESYCRKCKEPK
jgi:hypothetical protein